MDNEKKKSRLIRLLGKLGGKVRFLRKPLMVIAVVCVSIHHLIRQLFFDVKYHTARMRLITGAMCVALLFTLFVIPAIADEVFEIGTEIEILDSEEPTAEPVEQAPIIENEQPEEPTANQAEPEDDNDDQIYDDQTDSNDGQGDANAPTADANNTNNSANDGVTYDVDDEGNLIDPETGEKVKNSGIAARRVNEDYNIAQDNIKLKKLSGTNREDAVGPYTYAFGAVGSSEQFSVDVVIGNDEVPQSALSYKWVWKKVGEAGDGTVVKTTREYSLPASTSLYAGTYKLHCDVRAGNSAFVSSTDITIIITPLTLTSDNLSWSESGIRSSYYVTDREADSDIPKPVPEGAWVGTVGNITAEYVYYKNSNNDLVTDPWENPDTYYAVVRVTAADNYDPINTLFFNGNHTFTVERYKYNGDPYSISPSASGSEVDGHSNLKWYTKDDVDRTEGKVKITPLSSFTMSQTAPGTDPDTYSSASIEYDETKSVGQGPNELYFKYEGKYPVFDDNNTRKKYEVGQIIYLDKTLPTADIIFKVNGSQVNPGSIQNQNVTFEITTNPDTGAGINAATSVWYHISSSQTSGTSISDWTLGQSGTINSTDYPKGKVYVYVKLKDKAGNIAYIEDKLITMDTNAPIFTSDSSGRKIEGSKTYYVEDGKTKVITVSDSNADLGDTGLASVTCSPSTGVTIGNTETVGQIADGQCKVTFAPPSNNNPVPYTITATDKAGKSSSINITIARAETNVDEPLSKIVLGDESIDPNDATIKGRVYGYGSEDADVVKRIAPTLKAGNTLTAKVVNATLQSGTEFMIEGDKASGFTVRPIDTPLDVGIHTDVIELTYDLVQSTDNEFLSEHTANIEVSFQVAPAELTATYVGTTEYYHAKATYQFKDGDEKPNLAENEKWAKVGEDELAIKVSGFVYGQAATISTTDTTYKDPDITGRGTRHGVPQATTAPKVASGDGITTGVAKNYKFTYPTEQGNLKCVRRELGRDVGYKIIGTEGMIGENKTGWYTSGVTLEPITTTDVNKGYEILDHTSEVTAGTDKKGAQDLADANTYKPSGDVSGFSRDGVTYYNETTAAGINKYFYIHNKETDEISLLMHENIKIDRSAAHQVFTTGTPDTSGNETDGTLATKGSGTSGERPYLNVNADEWAEFLHTITFGMYFNARTTVGIKKALDDQSGIVAVHYLITDTSKDYADGDKDKWKSEIESSEGWEPCALPGATGETQFNVTKDVIEKAKTTEGYL